jgi:hypothetical protein
MPGMRNPTSLPLAIALAFLIGLAGAAASSNDDPPIIDHPGLPIGILDPMVASDGQHVYLFGGSAEGSISRNVYQVDPQTLEAEQVGQLPSPRIAGSVAYLQGKFYIFGGANFIGGAPSPSDQIIEYDPQSHQSRSLGLERLPNALFNTAAASDGQRAYIFGGYNLENQDRSDRIIEFDPTRNLNKARYIDTRLPERIHSASAAWDGQRFVIVGGSIGGHVKDTIHHFDPLTRSLSTPDITLPHGVRDAAVVAKDGTTYVFGGATRSDRGVGTDAIIEITDTSVRTIYPNLSSPRWMSGAGIVEDHAYLIAGRTQEDDYSRHVTQVDLARLDELAPSEDTQEEEGQAGEAEADHGEQSADIQAEAPDEKANATSSKGDEDTQVDDPGEDSEQTQPVPAELPGPAALLFVAITGLALGLRRCQRI